MSTVYVFGHKHPDNDAIMSAVLVCQLYNQLNDGNTYLPKRLGEMPPESAALLKSWDIEEPEYLAEILPPQKGEEPQKVILTDHNENTQTVDGIENAEVVGVVDHHRIGGFTTFKPISFIALPWGSACSIVKYLYKAHGVETTTAQKCMILSAMMTDTVMLKSPTTTDIDRKYAYELGEELGIDPIDFGLNIFMNRPTDQFSTDQMVNHDIKEFMINGKRVWIGQYETVDKTRALSMIPELRKSMEKFRKENDGATLVLVVTDIMEEGSQVFMCGDTEVVERGLGVANEENGVWMPGVLSRKKQLAAPIVAAGAELS